MIRLSCIVSSLILSILFCSCDKSSIEFNGKYEKSHQTWLEFKKLTDNSYRYVATGASWIGVSWKTTITVLKGTVVSREYEVIPGPDFDVDLPEDKLHWIEEGDQVGSHKDSGAADPLTLDEVYAKAKNEWLVKNKNREIFFETENNGMISSCGYVPNGCQDDCFQGINITSIVPLEELLEEGTKMSAIVEGDELRLTVTSSGCDGSTWTVRLIDLGDLAYSNPPQRSAKIEFENKESCSALLTKDFIFDLKPFRVKGSRDVSICLEGWSHPLLYQY